MKDDDDTVIDIPILGIPEMVVTQIGDGGIKLTFSCKNHPVSGLFFMFSHDGGKRLADNVRECLRAVPIIGAIQGEGLNMYADGAGGLRIVFRQSGHPADGLEMNFPREAAHKFLRSLDSALIGVPVLG